MAHGESPEEATAYVILDACFGVNFQEQPARIEFQWRKGRVDHYPDTLVVTSKVKEFWEFKKDHEAEDVLYRRRAERLLELLEPLGYGYRLVPTYTLMRGFYYRNAMEMRRQSKLARTLANWQAIVKYLKDKVPAPARVVLAKLPESQRLDVLLAALYAGELSTDFSVPITFDSQIHPPRSTSGEKPWVWELLEKSS